MNHKRIEQFETTMARSVYNKMHKTLHAGCDRCGWNRGCNRRYKGSQTNWKKYRLTQWKEN